MTNEMSVPPSLFDPLAQQSTIMIGLDKYTEYNITVLCFTDPGDGIPCDPISVTTQEDGKFNIITSTISYYILCRFSRRYGMIVIL